VIHSEPWRAWSHSSGRAHPELGRLRLVHWNDGPLAFEQVTKTEHGVTPVFDVRARGHRNAALAGIARGKGTPSLGRLLKDRLEFLGRSDELLVLVRRAGRDVGNISLSNLGFFRGRLSSWTHREQTVYLIDVFAAFPVSGI
jgi:hypothetical protein